MQSSDDVHVLQSTYEAIFLIQHISIDKCVADTVRALIGCRTTFYNEAARGDIYFTQSVVRARVSEAPVDLLGRERRATA